MIFCWPYACGHVYQQNDCETQKEKRVKKYADILDCGYVCKACKPLKRGFKKIAKKYNINPDFLVEADSYDDLSQKLQVIFSKNNISSDSYIVEFPTPISLYPKYLTFMANHQGLYSDNPIQIKRKTRKQF